MGEAGRIGPRRRNRQLRLLSSTNSTTPRRVTSATTTPTPAPMSHGRAAPEKNFMLAG